MRRQVGYVILSGLLVEQAEDVTAAYVANGLALAHREDIGEWSTLTLQKVVLHKKGPRLERHAARNSLQVLQI